MEQILDLDGFKSWSWFIVCGHSFILWLGQMPQSALSLSTPPPSHHKTAAVQMQLRHILVTTLEGQHGPIQSVQCRKHSTAWAGRERARGGQRSMGNLPAANAAEFSPP